MMEYTIGEKINKLLNEVSSMEEIKAIGQTGEANFIPKPGESDIDIFVFAKEIPGIEAREAVYQRCGTLFEECRVNVCEGGVWGTGDTFIIDGVETMLMYFRIDQTHEYINEVLEGKRLDSVKGFYPVGRLATLKGINVLYDEESTLQLIKDRLSIYPEELMYQLAKYHLELVNDEEDFGRAIRRKDVLFYHQVLEHCMDHFLQVIFAANKTFFPSRKRTKQYLDSFNIKPEGCYERLLEVIRLGATSDGIEASYEQWYSLVEDMENIWGEVKGL